VKNIIATLFAGALMAAGLALAQQPSTVGTSQQGAKPTKKPVQAQPSNAAGSSQIPPGADIEELAYVVLMNATNDQDKDLQEIENQVQKNSNAQALKTLQRVKAGGLAIYKPAKSSKKSSKSSRSAASSSKPSGVKPSH
jgi:hypothetical protein